jgi:hypothetical protein
VPVPGEGRQSSFVFRCDLTCGVDLIGLAVVYLVGRHQGVKDTAAVSLASSCVGQRLFGGDIIPERWPADLFHIVLIDCI